jgi:hypothetical protein
MRTRTSRQLFLVWFLAGTVAAAILQVGQTRVMGGVPEGLLFAGDLQEVHVLVQEELPRTPIWEGFGHDGQIFYAVGLDLAGEWVPDILLSSPYRYRRILYPALASGFGALGGEGLLWGMIVLAAIPMGLASGAAAALASHLGWTRLAPVLVILNPATWLSARLLTADNLALALGLLGLLAFVRRRDGWAIAALAAAALTKEPYLAFAAGIAGYAWFQGERWRATRLLTGATVPMLAWWGYIALAIGNPLDSGGNVVPPFVGLIDAVDHWPSLRPRDWLYLGAALLGVVASVVTVLRGPRLLAWLVGPWLLVAILSADLVWNVGNNAIRAFAPLFTLGLIAVTTVVHMGGSRSPADGTRSGVDTSLR